jgi:hypothetical protein
MAKARRRRRKADQDPMFAKRGKGTEITVTVEAGMIHTLDDYRDQVDTLTGVQLSRRQVLEGLLRKVWWDKFQEASVLTVGDKLIGQVEKVGK